MRFLFYDSITDIEKGKSIAGVKTFSLADEFLKGHYKKAPLVPGVLMIEAMAQLLGWLISYSHDFSVVAIPSTIERVTVSSNLRPGFKAEIRAEIVSTSKKDSLCKAEMYSDARIIASLDRIIYSHFQTVDSKKLAEIFKYYSGLKDMGNI